MTEESAAAKTYNERFEVEHKAVREVAHAALTGLPLLAARESSWVVPNRAMKRAARRRTR